MAYEDEGLMGHVHIALGSLGKTTFMSILICITGMDGEDDLRAMGRPLRHHESGSVVFGFVPINNFPTCTTFITRFIVLLDS